MKCTVIDVDHVAAAIIMHDATVRHALNRMTIDADALARAVVGALPLNKEGDSLGVRTPATLPAASRRVQDVLDGAVREALRSGSSVVDAGHVLLACYAVPATRMIDIFRRCGIDEDALRHALAYARRQQHDQLTDDEQRALHAFTTDLTELAERGALDPVIGREREIELVLTTLCRRSKNNPALIGDPGVGKTAIVEGLAQALVDGRADDDMGRRRVRVLHWASMMAGAAARGDFEARLTVLFNAIKREGSILFLDEMHLLLGAGGAAGGWDAANLLKPALARGDVRIIGATTMEEYRKYIERDAALERRFAPIIVDEPSPDAALAMLNALRERYERHHGVAIDPSALHAAVHLGMRYVPDRRLPDKALDLLDEACAAQRVQGWRRHAQGAELIQAERAAVGQGDYERAIQLRSARETVASPAHGSDHPRITERDVAFVVARRTGVSPSMVMETDVDRLQRLFARLTERVIGQDDALRTVADAVLCARAGVRDDRRPVSLMFVGPPGVGKTETARALAYALFGDERAMTRMDMNEFQEPHSIARLLGAPPGYVGYDDASSILERLRKRPYQVVLLDEIDKAHPNVVSAWLHALDDGRVTDNRGRTVSLRDAVIIMTSNAGCEATRPSSFGLTNEARMGRNADGAPSAAADDRRVRAALTHRFSPEFVDRIGHVIVFRPLGADALRAIAHRMIQETCRRVREERHVDVVISAEAAESLATRAVHAADGARAITRMISSELETTLAHALVRMAPQKCPILVTLDERGAMCASPAHPSSFGNDIQRDGVMPAPSRQQWQRSSV